MKLIFILFLVAFILISCSSSTNEQADPSDLMDIVTAEGAATERRISTLLSGIGLNYRTIAKPANEIDPLWYHSVHRPSLKEAQSHPDLEKTCEKIGAEIDNYDAVIRPHFEGRATIHLPNPTADNIRIKEAYDVFQNYRKSFRAVGQSCRRIKDIVFSDD